MLYENQISYEELRELMSNDIYATTLIDKAIEEKKNGYVIVENPSVTLFWEQYYALIRQSYPGVKINEVHGPKGNNVCWPKLTTYYQNVKIFQKSDRGNLDLTFSKMGNYPNIFHKYLDDVIEDDMRIEKTNKSMVVRINIPIIDFRSSFDDQIDKVKDSLDNIATSDAINITKIDKTAPKISSVTGNPTEWTKNNVTLTVNASDDLSGLAAYSFDNGATWQTENTKTYTENTSGIVVKVIVNKY